MHGSWPRRASYRAGRWPRRPSAGDDFWAASFREVATTGLSTVVSGLARALPDGRLRGGGPLRPGLLGGERHDEAPFDEAVVLPVGIGADRAAGVLVAGVSAYLALDDEYRTFLELVGHHVSTAATAADAFAAQQRRAEHLSELDRAKTAFFAGISDEFRTPLTLVLGPVAELREAAAPGSALRRGPGAGAPQRAAPAAHGRPAAGAVAAVRGAGRPAPRAGRPRGRSPRAWPACSGPRSSTPA